MSNGDHDIPSWVQWLAGGMVAGWVLFWRWMEGKIERLGDRIDALRENTRKDRHDLAASVQRTVVKIDEDIDTLKERVAKVEKDD